MKKIAVMGLVLMGLTLISCGPQVQEVIIRPIGNEMKYDQVEIIAKAGSRLRITMENTATLPIMIHNVVVLKPNASLKAVGVAAISAPNNIPDLPEIIAYTPQAKPGETTVVEFTVPPPGNYPYICTYPGHYITMKGMLKSVE